MGHSQPARDFVKAAVTLPWAISMFGVQQARNLLSQPSAARMSGAIEEIDAVSDASVHGLDGWAKQTYTIGAGVQRALVDMMMMRAPEFDQSTLMRLAAEMQEGPMFNAMVKYAMPPIGWLDSLRVNRRDAPAVAQEFSNKLQIILLVTHVHGELGLNSNTTESLYALIDKASAMPTFPRLWATEGLGNWLGDVALKNASTGSDVAGLISDPQYDALPPWCLTMLHAGIGMAFARAILTTLEPSSAEETVRAAIARFVKLCTDSSRAGYAGAALESLGLATRTLYPNMLRTLDVEIPRVHPDLHGYFWHGAGRAMYFEPMNMLPSANAPWRVIRRLDIEAPHDLARRNVLSGLGWAISVVNMRNPIVMETFLRHHAALVLAEDAFTNGVVSSLTMRYDTSPDDPYVSPYIHYEPIDAELASTWKDVIGDPCERALGETYGALVRTQSLEQLFHYRPGSV